MFFIVGYQTTVMNSINAIIFSNYMIGIVYCENRSHPENILFVRRISDKLSLCRLHHPSKLFQLSPRLCLFRQRNPLPLVCQKPRPVVISTVSNTRTKTTKNAMKHVAKCKKKLQCVFNIYLMVSRDRVKIE